MVLTKQQPTRLIANLRQRSLLLLHGVEQAKLQQRAPYQYQIHHLNQYLLLYGKLEDPNTLEQRHKAQ